MSAPQPTVTHRLTDKGVTLTVRQGSTVHLHPLSDGDARRLAWGILADLEPGEQPLASPRPRRRGEAPTRLAILLALTTAPGTRHDISRRAHKTITFASIAQTREHGFIERVEEQTRRSLLATWRLTDAGRAEIAKAQQPERIEA